MPDTINFYGSREPYFEFSNFARFHVTLDGKIWPTSEHYFQAQKFLDEALQEKVRLARTPRAAADMGRDRSNPLRADWETVKDDVMRKVVRAKFTQHAELKKLLLDTGDAIIVEHTVNDAYWGDGGDGSGKNMLGRILMEIRSELQA